MCFDKVRDLILPHRNRVRSMFLEILEIVEGGDQACYLCFWYFYRHYGGTQEIFWNEKLHCSVPGNILELGALLLVSFDKIRFLIFPCPNQARYLCFWSFYGYYRENPCKTYS